MKLRGYFLLFLFSIICGVSVGQKRTFDYTASLSGFISTDKNLPFWAVSGKYGIIPDSRGGLVHAGIFSGFNTHKSIQFAFGAAAAAYTSQKEDNILIDQLYLSGRWKKVRLDVGIIHPETEYNGLSSTNGSIIFSNNARAMPGINIRTDYIYFPFINNLLAVKANLGEYQMIDDRYVKDTRVHHKSVFVKITPHRRWEFVVGLEHVVMWAGDSPMYGKQPSSFKAYEKLFFGRGGLEGATMSDSLNALGNHLGREHGSVTYKGDQFTLVLYHDIPYEDASGTDFRSFPDGTYAFYFSDHNKNKWISDFLYEFYYTKYQSGSRHERPRTPEEMEGMDPSDPFYGKVILGGMDNYFNHQEYKSGWTYYGRTIGSPLMTAKKPNSNGITMGILNNRIIGHHVGIKGVAFHKIPYKALFTYSVNYGTYINPLADHSLKQFSFGVEVRLPEHKKIPFHVDMGLYGDTGQLLPDNFGMTLKIYRRGRLF